MNIGLAYYRQGDHWHAIPPFESVIKDTPDSLQARYLLGKDLADRSLARMADVGAAAMVHMLIGKAMLNLESYENAAKKLTAAAEADTNLPFVHFNLRLLYSKRGDYERAKEEFEKDIALEPDVVFNYDELGNVSLAAGDDLAAEKITGAH